MTSIKPNDAAASSAAGLDPVHPAPAPAPARTARATTQASAHATTARTRPAPEARGTHSEHADAAAQRQVASRFGTPAVLEHRVVALRIAAGETPLVVHAVDGEHRLLPLEAHVWARAGRMTVICEDSAEMKFTVLGPEESAGLRLGERWPAGEPESLPKRVAVAAVRDVGEVLTFPAWLARTTRLSGQRNAALHALVKRLREASPGTAVFYGQTFGLEHHRPEHVHPYDHRGIVGREGYPKEL